MTIKQHVPPSDFTPTQLVWINELLIDIRNTMITLEEEITSLQEEVADLKHWREQHEANSNP